MPLFIYVASKKDGTIVEEEIETSDQSAVVSYLEKHDLFPVSIKEKKTKSLLAFSFSSKITLLEKIMFARNLALMIRSGIGISEAIAILVENAERKPLQKILVKIRADIEKGFQLSSSLATLPGSFSPIFISLLKAGEESGNLESTLLQIAAQLKKESDLKKKILSAMAYPAILVSLAVGVVGLLVTVVLPRVSKIFAQAHVQLPLLTRILLAISDFVSNQIFATIAIIVGFIVLVIFARKSSLGKRIAHAIIMKLPLVASLMRKIALVRFTNTLHSLLKAGVPLIKALEITAEAVGNNSYKEILLDIAKNEISKGISFGMALKQRPHFFPPLISSMVIVGEKSGNFESVLESLGSFYEEEVDGTIKGLLTILEPVLLLCIGLLIGTIALSIVMPIYQMINVVH